MGWDRISELPDHLLAHILSYLGIYDSVKTSVLSKRWEFLWLNVSVLDVNVINFLPYGEAFANLMRRFFEFNRGRSCLQKFKIKLANNDNLFDYRKRVMEWIAELVHRGVEYLDVETDKSVIKYRHGRRRTPSGAIHFMPKYMYVSKTLVSLKLVNVGLEDTKFDVSLPCLKIMHLEKIHYRSNGFFIIGRFISASPVLEDLTLEFPFSNKKEEIDFSPNGSVSMESDQDGFLCFFPHSGKPNEVVFSDVPRCLSLALECVTINKLNMKEKTGIKLVNYFLENSAVLKKLTLSWAYASTRNQKQETYKELLTSPKLSRECQIFVH